MAKANPKKPKKKPVYALQSPFPLPKWPTLPASDNETLLTLLLALLAPISTHKTTHVQPSKGVRARRKVSKKRKRSPSPAPIAAPPPPSILSDLTLGFNSTTRALETLAAFSRPSAKTQSKGSEEIDPKPPPPLTVVLIPSVPGPQHAHLPLLARTASLAYPDQPTIRLVALGKDSELQIAKALDLPRLSMLGIKKGAEGSSTLVEFVREKVQEVHLEKGEQSGVWKAIRLEEVKRRKEGREPN
ncbi:MAG: hypothetical protein M1814_000011 [Vezdaea aestivalis]|nr:MAG: hypothetical protein M1814_000011 [Vezdaea aestivalis]